MRFKVIDHFEGKMRHSGTDANIQEIFVAVNQTPLGKFLQFEAENEKAASSIQSTLYTAYNKNKQFVKDRGFGVSVTVEKREITVWKRSADDVMNQHQGSKALKEFDRTQVTIAKKVTLLASRGKSGSAKGNGQSHKRPAKMKPWTTVDDKYLAAHKEGSMKDVAKHLKRTVASVYTRAYALRKNGQAVAADA